MLVLAQRWCNGSPAENRASQVVEALVITEDKGVGFTLYSAFYDPAAGQDLSSAYKWWNRGATGMLPHLLSHVMDIVSKWSLPADEATAIKQYCDRMDAHVRAMRQCFGSQGPLAAALNGA